MPAHRETFEQVGATRDATSSVTKGVSIARPRRPTCACRHTVSEELNPLLESLLFKDEGRPSLLGWELEVDFNDEDGDCNDDDDGVSRCTITIDKMACMGICNAVTHAKLDSCPPARTNSTAGKVPDSTNAKATRPNIRRNPRVRAWRVEPIVLKAVSNCVAVGSLLLIVPRLLELLERLLLLLLLLLPAICLLWSK